MSKYVVEWLGGTFTVQQVKISKKAVIRTSDPSSGARLKAAWTSKLGLALQSLQAQSDPEKLRPISAQTVRLGAFRTYSLLMTAVVLIDRS